MKMNKQILRKVCSSLLIATLMLSSAVIPGSMSYAATTPKDVKGHWAQKYVEKVIDAGIVKGYTDGTFRPENPVTRAEFSHMLNAALGNTGTASIKFKDVAPKDWYYSDVSKAMAAGYASGYQDNTFGPNRRITRQEVAVILSTVVPTYSFATSLSNYPDYNQIAAWAKPAMERMVGKGYINVYTNDKKLHPQANMTRAQAATVISTLLQKETIVKAPTTANSSQLSGAIYSNGVTVPKALGASNLELNKCVVLGTLSIAGGGTITLNNSRIAQATIQSTSNVTLVAKGETFLKNALASNTASLQTVSLTGAAGYGTGFASISAVKNAQVILNGTFPRISLDGASSSATLFSGRIDSLVVPPSGISSQFTAENGSFVTMATVAAPASLHGTGTISKLIANVSGITYEQRPTAVILGPGAKDPTKTAVITSIRSNPADGKIGTPPESNLTLTFSSAMKLYSGASIDNADLADLIQIRRDNPAGYSVPFTASIDSSKKVITIDPDKDLTSETKYYIIIPKNTMKDGSGTGNLAFLSTFTTSKVSEGTSVNQYLTFLPKDSGLHVATNVEPEIRFSEDMLFYDRTSLQNEDLSDIVVFREKNASGGKVSFDASLSGDKRSIFIEPTRRLEEGTTYYLAVNSDVLRTAARETVVPAACVTWTTDEGSDTSSSSDYVSFSPKNNKTGIAIDIEPQITFSEAMSCYDDSTLTNSKLDTIVIFREKNSSGRDVDFRATIDSAKKVVTIIPASDLKEDTKYYLAIDARSIKTTANGNKIPGVSVSWTTGKEGSSDYVSFYPRDGKKDVTRSEEPTITFSQRVEFYNGDKISSGRNTDLEDCITFEDRDGNPVRFKAYYDTANYEITITPTSRLSSGTRYTLSIDRKAFRTRADEEPIPAASASWTTE